MSALMHAVDASRDMRAALDEVDASIRAGEVPPNELRGRVTRAANTLNTWLFYAANPSLFTRKP